MTPTQLKWVLGTLVVAGALTVILWQYQTLQQLRRDNELLRQQIAQLTTENESASNRPASAGDSKPMTDGDINELLRLRGEVGMLRSQTNQLAKLQEENRRLQEHIAAVPQNQNNQRNTDPLSPEDRAYAVREINASRQAVMGMMMFAGDHQNQFPSSFDQAAQYFGDKFGDKFSSVFTNLSHFEIVYSGSSTDVSNPASAIVVRSIQPWSAGGKFSKAYGFADGHSEMRSDATGNFDTWEQEHAVVLKNP
jgi:hypothetical protein